MNGPLLTIAPRFVILTAFDLSLSAEVVIDFSTALAASIAGAELHLVHVLESSRSALEATHKRIDALLPRVRANFPGVLGVHTTNGAAAEETLRLASDLSADLIVLGPQIKTGLKRLIERSVMESIVRRASCAVLVARPKDYANGEPEIEPPCEDCARIQFASHSARLWCARHSERHVHGRLHYEVPESFAIGSSLIRPDGGSS